MKIDRNLVYTTLSSGHIYIHKNVSPHEFRALQTWCKNEGLKIRRRDGADVEISLKTAKVPSALMVSKKSNAAWLYSTLDRKEKEQDYEILSVNILTLDYVRSLISRYNRISSVTWRVTQRRPGVVLVYKDPAQLIPKPLPTFPADETENLI